MMGPTFKFFYMEVLSLASARLGSDLHLSAVPSSKLFMISSSAAPSLPAQIYKYWSYRPFIC